MTTYTTQYDDLFKAAGAARFPEIDWRWLKSQAIAESNLDPTAESPAGAQGIAQFMPDTWAQYSQLMYGKVQDVFDPILAIPVQAYYLKALWHLWTAPRTAIDHLQLSFASYNAGFGNILKAQKLARMARDYDSIIVQLNHVTGMDNANQTINYVLHIRKIYAQLVASDAQADVSSQAST
jgi:membrane-bound lytic murein transglycosylase F